MNESTAFGRKLLVNGIELQVHDQGQGPVVLLVHGFPDTHTVWREQIPALVAAGYRVIAPDTRGCGGSQLLPHRRDYALRHLVADLRALLDVLGIDRVWLAGHDWGAVIGWQFCIAHPERVERFAALSVGHPNAYASGGVAQKLKGWYAIFFQFPGIAEAALRARDWALFRRTIGDDGGMAERIGQLSRPGRLTAGLNYYRANLLALLRANWPRVRVPVLGVWSDGDRFLTEGQMRDSARWMDAPFRYERIDGVNHWLTYAAAARTNALLLDYFR